MLYSLLADEDIYFINLHAECALHTYSSEFYQYDIMLDARRTKGIYCKKVNANIFENIYEYDYEEKDICIDFSGIEEISKNNLVGFVSKIKKKICSKNQMVYFLILRKEIYEETGMENFLQINNDNNGNIFAKMGNAKGTYTYSQLIMRKEKVFKERLEKMILESTDECTETQHQHTSVPVYLSHYINLKKMVEAKSRLLRLAIYYLALSMIDAGIMSNNPLDNSNISFFFHTINGGYIATQLAELFHIDLVYLDHLGPIESVHRKHFEKSIRDNRNYIIVSDVICLGGEVGRARTIIEYCGGKILGEICLVDIKTIKNRDVANRISLYTVSNECNKIGYTIKTDLCDVCREGGTK